MKFLGFALILEWVSRAIAHGGVYTYNISGTLCQGNPWHIWDYGPFYGDGNSSGIPAGISSIQRRWYFRPLFNINFDGAATSNSLHAAVAAGSTIVVQYNVLNFTLTTVDKTLWYHQYGPMLVYMARCPGDTCAGFDGKGAIWFKIAQYGLTPEAMNLRGPWLQASMLTGENATGRESNQSVS